MFSDKSMRKQIYKELVDTGKLSSILNVNIGNFNFKEEYLYSILYRVFSLDHEERLTNAQADI